MDSVLLAVQSQPDKGELLPVEQAAEAAKITEALLMTESVEELARVCHEVNRAYCAAIGDKSQVPWDEAPEWQRQSVVNGVRFIVGNPSALPSASHESWMEEKRAQGWKYGPVKDVVRKEHPCFMPYEQLPPEQRVKDHLFQAVVRTLAPMFGLWGW
jgi:hypothetical protein